eukprot:TRINITY_DN13111_c0_g1_i1.p1 TRINITY_DN13111_c0_g1~~TRINITY_DN13111_c0_g1_i1.p1  ORF type:complete len:101 (-),score=34.56 TRINITY_DN13111_c0_g1_i1:217-519(-)
MCYFYFFFFFKQKTAYEMLRSLVGSEMCIRDRVSTQSTGVVELDSDPSRLLSCDCFKVSFRPFPVLTEKQREIYLSSDYGTSVLDFYDKGGNDPLKHFVH